MRVHHISCGTMCPLGGHLWDGFSHGWFGKLVCHCWLIESGAGLILIDTGLARDPAHRASPLFAKLNRPSVANDHSALSQIERMGFSAHDVRHVILTHLDFDHAGGIVDFPNARVHVMEAEYLAARAPRGYLARRRYRTDQWTQARQWTLYHADGERWFDFEAVRALEGLPPEILMVPLVGHSAGHAGVAVHTNAGWMLHAGDAYFFRGEMDVEAPSGRPASNFYQRIMAQSPSRQRLNQRRLRRLIREHSGEVRVCSSHDAIELSAYQAAAEPTRRLTEQVNLFTPHPAR